MKKKIIIIAIILILVGIVGAIIMKGLSEKEEDTLVLAIDASFAPYEYYEDGEIVGIDIEIAKGITEKLGKKLVIKDMDFAGIINEIKSGKADFTAPLTITEERAKEIDFSIECATAKQVIITNSVSNIKGPDDLKNKKVAVQLGTVADIKLSDDYKDVEVVQYPKYLICIEELLAGNVDAVIMEEIPANYYVDEHTELVIAEKELLDDSCAIAVKKGNTELLNLINKAIEELTSEGKIEEYTMKYMGE